LLPFYIIKAGLVPSLGFTPYKLTGTIGLVLGNKNKEDNHNYMGFFTAEISLASVNYPLIEPCSDTFAQSPTHLIFCD
jgi:hypothetical protein